ncbi:MULTISPECIES: SIMPL domain-containing protein [unclassified Chelatococcus]|uniref:SIMPL domain-containing protein n=1 Tax=unclassified Chelatococcus TaxID=2638111 RepID=UPI001BD03240|nr:MULTISPECIES: SIMPL domain-containing protein [unclassified Chelatococcus]CAH1670284.1 26 kDa periplasmic immunogenic protein [Hyphomicrobiales bacterium]MBS7738319.1 SIMPL domain-containing protein [Chelatococcus sp. HY11]MBX3545847.1 SIMPL domain-containing protein [Chelatococcus sp.]MCO5077335.1 SIMPL domain-containing protein [Chelatococcus sp.]CAH1677488.1 26 kDa periplasmic immunogenic protein [Hyphomicrobiales bacterium]
MKISAPLVFALALIGAAGAANAQDNGAGAGRARPGQITITGEGSVSAAPDIATLSTNVVTTAKSAREATEANSKAMTAVIERFKAAGIEARDLSTSGFSVQPRYVQSKQQDEAPRIDGYEVRNGVTVRIRDLSKLGAILDTAITAGANQINGISFDVAEPSALLDKAGTAAVKDARRRAELYADAAGVKLGRVIAIAEPSMEGPRPMMMAARADFAKSSAVPIEAGERDFNVRIRVTYEISQ